MRGLISTPLAHNLHAHVTLDGRASFDPDGFVASAQWTEGPTVLSNVIYDSVEFELGEHLVTLTITDNDGLTHSDSARVIVTQTAESPQPYWCADQDGDAIVSILDLATWRARSGSSSGRPDTPSARPRRRPQRYHLDLAGAAGDFGSMPARRPAIRLATIAMEPYQSIYTAILAGYSQITPWIPGQGLHMLKGGVAGLGGQDLVFDPGQPESLLYEPDSASPYGWRLGGAMYVIPYNLTPLPPDGFATNEDAWHYHDSLCIWNNGQSVSENTPEATCLARPNPVWIERAGWLVHLWNFVPNPTGRFVEVSNSFVGLP
jgi:hypothetical protein